MNPAHINSKETLQELINVDIKITGDLDKQQEELYYNTWGMSFDRDFIKTLTIQDINNFVIELIKNRSEQVLDINKGPATFYLWYDEQSVCLCFDILSGANITLPFRCRVNIVSTPLSIIHAFLKDAQAEIHPLDFQNFKFFEPGDPGWDEFDEEEEKEDVSLRTVNVYVVILPQSDIANFFKKIISS
jgi:hypothetical protein